LEHDPAVRKKRRQVVERSGLRPLLRRNVFDRSYFVQHQQFFPVAREAQCPFYFLPRFEMKSLRESARHAYIFRDRKKVQARPSEDAERISNLIKKTFRCDRNSQAERGTKQVQNLMVSRPPGMQAQLKIATEFFDFRRSERLQFIQVKRCWDIGN